VDKKQTFQDPYSINSIFREYLLLTLFLFSKIQFCGLAHKLQLSAPYEKTFELGFTPEPNRGSDHVRVHHRFNDLGPGRNRTDYGHGHRPDGWYRGQRVPEGGEFGYGRRAFYDF
jgi:hypothetical protein